MTASARRSQRLVAAMVLAWPALGFGGSGNLATGAFNFCVSVRYKATDDELKAIRTAFQSGSNVLLDATDGAHRFGKVLIVNESAAGGAAEYWVNQGTGRADADRDGYGRRGQRVRLYGGADFSGAKTDGFTIAHEHAHLAYTVRDEYAKPSGAAAVCVPEPAMEPEKLSTCLMDNYYTRGGKKAAPTLDEFCVKSNHDPDKDTKQHDTHGKSCWETIAGCRHPITAPAALPVAAAPAAKDVTFPAASGQPRVFLLIDRSGSMKGEKLAAAKRGASGLIKRLRNGDGLAVIDYDHKVRLAHPFTTLAKDADRDAAAAAVTKIDAGGDTAIGDALKEAVTRIKAVTPASCQTLVVLVSDGHSNTGTDPASLIPALKEQFAVVLSVAVGRDADTALLTKLATETGGKFIPAPQPADIERAMLALTADTAGGGVIDRSPGRVASGERDELGIAVDDTTGRVTFAVAWPFRADDLDLSLRTPDGRIVTRSDPDPTVTFLSGDGSETIVIEQPSPGTWSMLVDGIATAAAGADYEATALSDSGRVALVAGAEQANIVGASANRIVSVPTFDGPVVGALLGGTLRRPDGSSLSVALADDGDTASGDDDAGDGIYTLRLNDYAGDGTYVLDLFGANETGQRAPGEDFPGRDVPPNTGTVTPFMRREAVAFTVSGTSTVSCPFDVDGDDVADLVAPDLDGDGFCDFPTAKTHLHGTLRFKSGAKVEFRGNTIVEADTIVIEAGATLSADAESLHSLTMVAVDGDLSSRGALMLSAGDDLTLESLTGAVDFGGTIELAAGDRLVMNARQGDVRVVPAVTPFDDVPHGLAGNLLEVRANGRDGVIQISGARLWARRVRFDGRANVSVVGVKGIRLDGGTHVSTDPADTRARSVSDVSFDASGPIVISGATVDSGRNLTIQTRRSGDSLCLLDAARLEARDTAGRPGRIQWTGVRGSIRTDGSAITLDGIVVGPAPVVGPCP